MAELDFESFFRTHYAFVYRALKRSTGPYCADIDDLVQEVFLIAMNKFKTFDGGSRPTTWLYGIAWRVASQYRRRQNLRKWFSLGDHARAVAQIGQEPEIQMIAMEDCRYVYDILDNISEKKRQTLILYEIEGYSGEEIAKIMNCKEATVWTRLHYAREEYKKQAFRRASTIGKTNASGQGTEGGNE